MGRMQKEGIGIGEMIGMTEGVETRKKTSQKRSQNSRKRKRIQKRKYLMTKRRSQKRKRLRSNNSSSSRRRKATGREIVIGIDGGINQLTRNPMSNKKRNLLKRRKISQPSRRERNLSRMQK